MHVEVYAPAINTRYYFVNRDELFKLQVWHPQQRQELAVFDLKQTPAELFDKIRADVTRLRKDLIEMGHTERLLITVFELGEPLHSWTEHSVKVLGRYLTGDDTWIDGELIPLQFHDTIYDQA